MYLCLDCGNLFEEPQEYIERHGFDYPPYETWHGCPKCAGVCIETIECSICGEYIIGDYIELKDGEVVCDCCYQTKNIYDWT